MDDSEKNKSDIKKVAEESLDAFSEISEKAKSAANKAGSAELADKLGNIREALAYKKTAKEPAIARVVVVDEENKRKTYYICRYTPPPSLEGITLASRNSPLGRLAALPVGGEDDFPIGGEEKILRVVGNAKFSPKELGKGWDSVYSVLYGENYGPLTIRSLRALIQKYGDGAPDLLEQLISEEESERNVIKGILRQIVQSISLRDQPTLDQYQDRIFRLPINSRLLMLGPPGTGKTTTLIRRLGQKLDPEFLSDDEKRIVEQCRDGKNTWLMFTPTKSLKLYVKEAFNREEIPAPDDCIYTWEHFRQKFARDELRILKSPSGGGSFVMPPASSQPAPLLKNKTLENLVEFFSDFEEWQKESFFKDMRASAEKLSGNLSPDIHSLGEKLVAACNSGATTTPAAFISLIHRGPESPAENAETLSKNLKKDSDEKIKQKLSAVVSQNRAFLDELAWFIRESLETSGRDEEIDLEAEEEEDASPPSTIGRKEAMGRYMQAIRSQATARASGRKMSPTSKTGRLIEWLGDRTLPEQELKEVGASLITQAALRRFVNLASRYINGIPARYRAFRRHRQAEGRWYVDGKFDSANIHPIELDIVLLAMLRNINDLPEHSATQPILEKMQAQYRTQVLVDEATDFSPIQLACMAALAHPKTKSFFACGDFNQRLTEWGTRTRDQMKWALKDDIEIEGISIPYRQSRRLHDFAQEIATLSGEKASNIAPPYAENKGVQPVLATPLKEKPDVAKWLAARVREVGKFHEKLPSIAVLVHNEDEVDSVAEELKNALADQNINVVACRNGEVRGEDDAVRVFNVEHIKGLEFEAVFFVGVDRLAEAYPTLFDKYLYVGATRAAAYLGIACEKTLPEKMAGLQGFFAEDWAQHS